MASPAGRNEVWVWCGALALGLLVSACGGEQTAGDATGGSDSASTSGTPNAGSGGTQAVDGAGSTGAGASGAEGGAEATYSMELAVNQMPAPMTFQCPAEPRTMVPNQIDGASSQLVLGPGTTEAQIEGMTILRNDSNGDRISCRVGETGDGAFSVSAEIDTQNSLTTLNAIERNIFELSAEFSGGFGTGSLFWLHQGTQYTSTTCNFTTDVREDGTLFMESGKAKFTFLCRPFDNDDRQSCEARGTVYVTNCN